MTHPIPLLESAWEQAMREERRLSILLQVRDEAGAALGRGDVARCIACLTVLAAMGGQLFRFQAPAERAEPAAWRPVLERLRLTLDELEEHNHLMLGRLQRHLRSPRPWNPAWRASVARTARLQEQHVRRWHAAVALLEASQDAMTP